MLCSSYIPLIQQFAWQLCQTFFWIYFLHICSNMSVLMAFLWIHWTALCHLTFKVRCVRLIRIYMTKRHLPILYIDASKWIVSYIYICNTLFNTFYYYLKRDKHIVRSKKYKGKWIKAPAHLFHGKKPFLKPNDCTSYFSTLNTDQ